MVAFSLSSHITGLPLVEFYTVRSLTTQQRCSVQCTWRSALSCHSFGTRLPAQEARQCNSTLNWQSLCLKPSAPNSNRLSREARYSVHCVPADRNGEYDIFPFPFSFSSQLVSLPVEFRITRPSRLNFSCKRGFRFHIGLPPCS